MHANDFKPALVEESLASLHQAGRTIGDYTEFNMARPDGRNRLNSHHAKGSTLARAGVSQPEHCGKHRLW
jgi:hypothetical protein